MASTAAKAETKAPAATKPAKPAAPAASKPAAPAASKPAAPVASKPAAPAASKPAAKSTGKVEKKRAGRPRNYNLGNGIYRFSRTRMYHKKAVYKFVGKKTPPAPKPKRPIFVEKPIGGEKNGGKRIVLIKKRRNYYPTQDKIKKRHPRGFFRKHKRHLRSTLTPGTIAVLLAGPHKGKRVVVLKQLSSGLLLVTGPFLINACPMRRINQIYVIGTATKINMTEVKLPEHIDDKYFKRQKKKRAKKEEGDIFAKKKERYRPSEQRKSDQKIVDKMVISAIKKHPDRKVLFAYLSAMFGLRSSQYPHRMKF